jgi:hypothetical protein
MMIKQLSVFLENKSGRLTEVTRVLGENDINISAFSIADTADFGILRMIVTKPDEAVKLLKEQGFSVHITDVICIIVPDKPGGLYKALDILSNEKISIEYMYAYSMGNEAFVVIRTDSAKEAIEIFRKHKLELVNAGDIYKV